MHLGGPGTDGVGTPGWPSDASQMDSPLFGFGDGDGEGRGADDEGPSALSDDGGANAEPSTPPHVDKKNLLVDNVPSTGRGYSLPPVTPLVTPKGPVSRRSPSYVPSPYLLTPQVTQQQQQQQQQQRSGFIMQETVHTTYVAPSLSLLAFNWPLLANHMWSLLASLL
jgi:hypothetical protein